MTRETITKEIPDEWERRRNAGLCPVCGLEAESFQPKMKVFCSPGCRELYAKQFQTWENLRDKILERDGVVCKNCDMTQKEIRDIRENNLKEGMRHWVGQHPNKVAKKQAELVVALSEQFEREYKEIFDVEYIFNQIIPYHQRSSELNLPHTHVTFEVDHILAVCNGGDMWDPENCQVLCKNCHHEKTKKDLRILRKNKKEVK